MDYDVLILGGGIVGCTVAYELSKYNLNIALIEKASDIAEDISLINTSVVYDGSETTNEIISEYERKGCKLIEESCKKFNVPYKKVGALRVASNDYGVFKLKEMYNLAKKRGIENISLLDKKEVLELENNINIDVSKGLYSEEVAVVSPYELSIAYAEVAADNGVNFRFEEEVVNIAKISKGFKVTTNKNKFTCRVVINTTPFDINMGENINEQNYNIKEESTIKNVNYMIVNKNVEKPLNRVVITVMDENKFAVNIPSVYHGYIIGIKDSNVLSSDERIISSRKLMPTISKECVNSIFNDIYKKDIMYIDDKNIKEGYIKVTGTHYGKIGIAPAIAKEISEVIASNIKTTFKKEFIDKRRDVYKFKNMSIEEKNELISLDSRYGKIVCLCNEVTEGEIIDCIRRPLGARTLDGIRRRTGVCNGPCKGSYCSRKIINILAREMDKKPIEIVKDSKNYIIWNGRIKEFDSV